MLIFAIFFSSTLNANRNGSSNSGFSFSLLFSRGRQYFCMNLLFVVLVNFQLLRCVCEWVNAVDKVFFRRSDCEKFKWCSRGNGHGAAEKSSTSVNKLRMPQSILRHSIRHTLRCVFFDVFRFADNKQRVVYVVWWRWCWCCYCFHSLDFVFCALAWQLGIMGNKKLPKSWTIECICGDSWTLHRSFFLSFFLVSLWVFES